MGSWGWDGEAIELMRLLSCISLIIAHLFYSVNTRWLRATIVEVGWRGVGLEMVRLLNRSGRCRLMSFLFFSGNDIALVEHFGSLFPVCFAGIITRTYVLVKCARNKGWAAQLLTLGGAVGSYSTLQKSTKLPRTPQGWNGSKRRT